ncbi:MAG TPA: hypothetical protein V6C81_19665 [Planktothrix sp.]|jgi:hypothetical protein
MFNISEKLVRAIFIATLLVLSFQAAKGQGANTQKRQAEPYIRLGTVDNLSVRADKDGLWLDGYINSSVICGQVRTKKKRDVLYLRVPQRVVSSSLGQVKPGSFPYKVNITPDISRVYLIDSKCLGSSKTLIWERAPKSTP